MKGFIKLFVIADLGLLLLSLFASELSTSFPLLELVPTFDWLILVFHICLIVAGLIFHLRIQLLILTTILWGFLNYSRHGGPLWSVNEDDRNLKLTVLTLNTHHFEGDTAALFEFASDIASENYDLVFLQEFGNKHYWPNAVEGARLFSRRSDMPHFDFSPRAGNVFGTAIFSRYPIENLETLYQGSPEFNEVQSYSMRYFNRDIFLVNVHLESYNLSSQDSISIHTLIQKRLAQARTVNRFLSERKGDVIVAGDLNAVSGTQVYDLVKGDLHDVQKRSGNAWLSTYKVFPCRIDHLFVSDSIQVKTVELLPQKFSDHIALKAVLELN